MKATKAIRFANVAMAAVAGLLTLPLQAQIKSHSGNLIVEQPANLPEMAQTPGQALFLYQVRDGETYLTSSRRATQWRTACHLRCHRSRKNQGSGFGSSQGARSIRVCTLSE
jgi:hypothetical protein